MIAISSGSVPRGKYKQLKRKYHDLLKEKSSLESKLKEKEKEKGDKPSATSLPLSQQPTKPPVERAFSILQMLSPRSSKMGSPAATVSAPAITSGNPAFESFSNDLLTLVLSE